ncbi:MAG: histidine phosphatase family protein [Chloroflexi bacterium]|nr:histidine phosphatase family protein [Chloroflexota bacterium]
MTSEIYTITFLRHGESVGNMENRFQGHADFPLTEKGRLQARALAERWQAEGVLFDRAFSSPLLRARETAEVVCTALGVPLEFDPDWMEMNNGLLAGLSDEEAEQVAPRPDFMTPYTRFGRTGESRWEVYLRAGRAVQRILDQPARSTLIVAHGGILNMTMYAILGIPLQADFTGPRFMFHNTTFTTFTYEAEHHNWRMLHFDNRPHLKGEE